MRFAFALVFVASFLLIGCASDRPHLRVDSPYRDPSTLEKGQILHVATGRLLTQDELLEYLARYRVVYVGETHDNVDDHAVELAVLRGLHERYPGQLALGLEMLRRPSQADVDAYIRGEMEEKDFLQVWQKNWGPTSFPYYREILNYARQEQIPVLALNAGKDLRKAVREKGLDHLAPEMADRLPDMDFEDPYYRAFAESMYRGHPHGSDPEMFQKIQVLWDETMAQTAAEYLASPEGRGKRLVVFAGGNHVRYGFGIPRRVFRRVPVPYVVVDPYTVEYPEDKLDKLMDVELPELPMPPADVYWAVGYEDLEDQRVMLGVQIEDVEEEGVRVLGVIPKSPAALAGIEKGDVIVSVDGDPVGEVSDLTYRVGLHKPGDVGPVEVLRGGDRLALEVTYDVVRHGR